MPLVNLHGEQDSFGLGRDDLYTQRLENRLIRAVAHHV
jgi:hypothetical protein